MTLGSQLPSRYELLGDAAAASSGPLARARDLAFQEIVAIKQAAPPGTPLARFKDLQAELRKVQRWPHPALVRHDALHLREGLLVREWVHGFSLLELLKRRRELPIGETLLLLSSLPATLDFMAAKGLPFPRPLLGKLFVEIAPEAVPEEILRKTFGKWPAFSLRLNPLSLRALLREEGTQSTVRTIGDIRTFIGDDGLSAPARLAGLLYEVLGGPVRSGLERRYTPLPALREEGNGVLRRALLDASFEDCASLWLELASAEALKTRLSVAGAETRPPPPGLHIAAGSAAQAQAGTLLKLTPTEPTTPAIHLIAKPALTIGRSLFHADFIARFLPESPKNTELTNQISRVHVLAERTRGQLTLRDGNGRAPSVNGTTLDERPLAWDAPVPFASRVSLILGGVYPVEVIPLLVEDPPPLSIEGRTRVLVAPEPPGGAVLFVPGGELPLIRHAIWLFSEIGFGLDGARRVIWDQRHGRISPASFHYHQGAFWLGNRTLVEGLLECGSSPVNAGEIVPLVQGCELRLGTVRYTVECCA